MKQNHFKWCMCMDLSHDVQILLKGFWGILCRDFSISIMHCDVIFIHLHIKRFLISEEVSDLWRSCEKLLFIISRVFFNSESLFFKLNSLLHMYFKLEQFDNFKICQLTYKFAHVNILTQSKDWMIYQLHITITLLAHLLRSFGSRCWARIFKRTSALKVNIQFKRRIFPM